MASSHRQNSNPTRKKRFMLDLRTSEVGSAASDTAQSEAARTMAGSYFLCYYSGSTVRAAKSAAPLLFLFFCRFN